MKLSDESKATSCSFSKSFAELPRAKRSHVWNDGKSVPSDVRVLEAVVGPDEMTRSYDDCRFVASIYHERGFPIAHFVLETEDMRIDWLADARDIEIQESVAEWKNVGHVYIALVIDGMTKRKLTVPFAMSTSSRLPEPVDFSKQNACRRREFAALAVKLIDTESLQTLTVDSPCMQRRLVSANIVLTEASRGFVRLHEQSKHHDLLGEKLLRQESIFSSACEFSELTDATRINDEIASLPLPTDAIVLTACLQYPEVLEQHETIVAGHLNVMEIKRQKLDILLFTCQTDSVRLDFVGNPGDPEMWRAIDSWKKHGKAFILLQFEGQHHLLTPRFESSTLRISRPDFSKFVFVDNQTRRKSRFVKARLDDRHSPLSDVYKNLWKDCDYLNFQYYLIHLIRTKTSEDYRAFLEEKIRLEAENPIAGSSAFLPPIGCSGTSSSESLEEIRSNDHTEVHCALIPTVLLPEEVQALVFEDKCVCIRVPDDFVENAELLKSWAIDSYTRTDHQKQRRFTYISFGSGHVEVFGVEILDFLKEIETQCPVLFLRSESWFLKIYDWHEDWERDSLQVAFFQADNFRYLPEEEADEAQAERNLTPDEREKLKRPLLATQYWIFNV